MFTEEEIKNLKNQIFGQIDENFPEDKKDTAKAQINSMNDEEFESFLKKNNIIKTETEKCIFCSIVSGEIPSYLVGENEKAIAVLEINPVSKAHVLIIPKQHDLDLKDKSVKKLEKDIFKKIKSKFKPKEVKIIPSELFGHKVLNIFPVYSNETMSSKRIKVSKEELEEIRNKLNEKKPKKEKAKPKPKKEKIKEEEKEEKLWLPRRIP